MMSFKQEINLNYKSLYDFQYFNCPACIFKDHSKQEFVNHVFENHPEISKKLRDITDDSIKDVIVPWNNLKEETLEKHLKVQNDVDSTINEDYNQTEKKRSIRKKVQKLKPDRKKKPAGASRNHLPEGICPICKAENIGGEGENLKIHLETVHKKLIKIPPKLRKSYSKKKSFDPNDEYCPICNENIDQQISVLKEHVKETHHRILCNICKRHFAKTLTLKRHVNAIHQKNRSFECPICDYTSSTKQVLQRHIIKIHPKEFDFDLKSQKESRDMMAKISEVFVSKEQPKKKKIEKQVKVDESGEIVSYK